MIIDLMLLTSLLCPASGQIKNTSGLENYLQNTNILLNEEENTRTDYYDGLNVNWDNIAVTLSLTDNQKALGLNITSAAIAATNVFYSENFDCGDDDAFALNCWSALLTYNFGDALTTSIIGAYGNDLQTGIAKTTKIHNAQNGMILYHEYDTKISYSGPSIESDIANFIHHCVANGEVYDCVKPGSNGIEYTTLGTSDPDTYGIKGFVDSIDPGDYDYAQQYYFYTRIEDVTTNGGATISTHRLRTGYIENEFIVLSPRREGAGTAFLAFYPQVPVLSIHLDMCLWSQNEFYSNETNSITLLERVDQYSSLTRFDILNDYPLSTDRTALNHYRFNFGNPVNGFEFHVNAPAVGDRNKGRFCIKNMTIIFANPNY